MSDWLITHTFYDEKGERVCQYGAFYPGAVIWQRVLPPLDDLVGVDAYGDEIRGPVVSAP